MVCTSHARVVPWRTEQAPALPVRRSRDGKANPLRQLVPRGRDEANAARSVRMSGDPAMVRWVTGPSPPLTLRTSDAGKCTGGWHVAHRQPRG
jgi:hypothetical protein